MSAPDSPDQPDFFLCDILDAIPKDDMATMEHPVFSLATRPDLRVLRYARGAARIEITPSVRGLATIHDKDILIYAVSQLVAALNAGRPTARTLDLRSHDLLRATGRETSGNGYRRLREAFERLAGTRITTNIVTGPARDGGAQDPVAGQGIETTRGFGLIDSWEILRLARTGRMLSVRLTLSDWLYQAVLSRSVLTLSRDYFSLRKPLERRLYEIARKHCGHQPRWTVGLEALLAKTGSASPRRVFRSMIREIAAADGLPDYHISFDERDMLQVTPRAAMAGVPGLPPLPGEVLEAARAAAPGYDVHALEADWRAWWVATGRPKLRAPGRAFVSFAARRAATRPLR